MSNSLANPVPVPRRRRWRRYVVAMLIVVGIGLYVGRSFLLVQMAEFLDVSETPRAVDYLLILGGGSDTRPFVAAALYKEKLVGHILVSITRRSPQVEDGLVPAEDEIVRKVLTRRGVPESAILSLDGVCDSTRDEAEALSRFLDKHPESSVAVLTTTYHTRRTRMLFRKVLGDRAASICFLAAPADGFDKTNWWRFQAGFHCYVNEYVKMAAGQFGF